MVYRPSKLEAFFSRDSMRIVFEPVVDLEKDGRLHGNEALMRGPRGMPFEGPMLAFALARSLDRVEELDLRCIEAAVAVAPKDVRLFLNVHPATLAGSGPRIFDLMQAAGRDPSSVVIEVLEHPSAGETDLMRAVKRAKLQGFLIAIDDFGQGASNLDRLLRLEPDYLKIDRLFLIGAEADTRRQAILRATSNMGRQCGARVIAEGLENHQQAKILRNSGIALAQGRWLSEERATPVEKASESGAPAATDVEARVDALIGTIDTLGEDELDRLPFGVIQLTADGTILQYNRYEESISSFSTESVIGRNFFVEVAPCTDVRDFAGRFREGIARGQLHTTFEFVFAFDPPQQVKVTLYLSQATNTIWVFVEG